MPTAVDLKRQIYSLRDLPTLPVVARKILMAADEESNSYQSLAAMVSRDQALTAKVLGLANSAYYGHRARVRTLNHAIAIIGTAMLKQLSPVVFIIQSWGSKDNPERTRFWQHSIAAAHAASLIAEESGRIPPEEAFCAGLLHDIGALVLEMCFPEAYGGVRLAIDDDTPLDEVERRVLEVDHAQAGGWLAERWQLPPALIAGIAGHHSGGGNTQEENDLIHVIRIADAAATHIDMGLGGEQADEAAQIEAFGLSEAHYTRLVEQLEDQRGQIEAFLSLV